MSLARNFDERPELYAAYGARGNAGDDIGLLVMRRSLDSEGCAVIELAWVDKKHPLAMEVIQEVRREMKQWCAENNITRLTAVIARESGAADTLMAAFGFRWIARVFARSMEDGDGSHSG